MASFLQVFFSKVGRRLSGSGGNDSQVSPRLSFDGSGAGGSVSAGIARLHHPRDDKALIDALTKGHLSIHVNEVDESYGGAPIHSILRHSSHHRHKPDLLVTLLTYSNADVNLPDTEGKSPLHIAAEIDNVECAKVLIAFGANLNSVDREDHTPLDTATSARRPVYLKSFARQGSVSTPWTFVCTDSDQQPRSLMDDVDNGTIYSEVGQLLVSVGAKYAECTTTPPLARKKKKRIVEEEDSHIPGGFTLDLDEVEREEEEEGEEGEGEREEEGDGEGEEEGDGEVKKKPERQRREKLQKVMSGYDLTASERRGNYNLGAATRLLYREMEDHINQQTNSLMSLRCVNEMVGMQMQRKEIARYRATGARILCLDGGGMKGLVEIDVLQQLEEVTGKSIPELFDWVVATSTGAIIILGMLYAKKSLKELRQIYYRLKDNVFASPRFGISYNTEALEKLLIDVFGTEMTLEHDRENIPKVIITAVCKKSKAPEIQYFNNCLDDDLCKTPVWKVARCTSAAPMFFSEFEDHVDGGVLANNPCQVGLTKIEDYHWSKQQKLPIALVVSVGSGIYPQQKLGSINAQQYLYFGAHWLKLKDTLQEIRNLAELLANALVESETVADATNMHCRERGIDFYRVSPDLDDIIAAGETSNDKLTHMVVSARGRCRGQIAEIGRKLCPDDVQA